VLADELSLRLIVVEEPVVSCERMPVRTFTSPPNRLLVVRLVSIAKSGCRFLITTRRLGSSLKVITP